MTSLEKNTETKLTLDVKEAGGKTNGTVKGVAIFDAGGANMGGFVRGTKVECGDYPVKDIMDSDSGEHECLTARHLHF